MSYNEELQSNNADLEDILATVNDLPEAGRGLSGTTVDKITGIDTYELGDSEIQTADESGIAWGDKFHIFCEDNTEVSGDIFHNIPIVAGDDIAFEVDQGKVVKISVQGGGYQTKTDESLNTTDKTIVGAINEIDSKPTYYTSGLIYTLSDDGTYYFVTGFDENLTDTEIKIAPIYKGLPVKEIGASAFKNCFYARNIEIPDSVTIIGTQAFASCTNLYSVTFGENSELEEITGSVFRDSWRLVNVKLPNSIKIIGASAFYNCGLKSIVIPEGVTTIGDYAFENCGLLTTIEIPVSVTSIGVRAFNSSSYATDVFYTGTQAEWEAIDIGEGNTNLPDVVATVEEDENLPEAATFSLRNTRIAKSTIHFSYANNFASVAKKLQKVVEEGGSGNVDLSGYLPLSGGIMTGDINLGTNKGFTGTTASGNNFDIFRVLNSTRLQVGGTYPALELKGKNERPTYNGNDMALLSDIPSEPDIDLTSYQTKTDEALETESKEVVGAINELKALIAPEEGDSNVWTFNDTLTLDTSVDCTFNFTFDGYDNTNVGTQIAYASYGGSCPHIEYNTDYYPEGQIGNYQRVVVYCFDESYNGTVGWVKEEYKTIIINEMPTDEAFLTWLKANATQGGSDVEIDLTPYQRKVDGFLQTKDNTIVGAINEINEKVNSLLLETWVLNDTLTSTEDTWTYSLEFTSNNSEFTSISRAGAGPPGVRCLKYGSVQVYIFESENMYGLTPGWSDEAYKTITFTEEPTDEAFLTWLKANATKQGGSDNSCGLPPCDSTNEGQFLRVVNGVATWATIPNAEEATF